MYRDFRKKNYDTSYRKNLLKNRDDRSSDDMKNALNDEKRLKKERKRLSLDWFFRPQ